MKNTFILLAAIIFISACESEVDLDLNDSEPQIVIEGTITDGSGPYYVKITRSVNFNEPNSYPPITGAVVTISDSQDHIDVLTEVSDGLYETSTIVGVPGLTYYLNVQIGQTEYTATSFMPEKVNLDTLKFEASSGPGGDFSALPVYTDPQTPDNRYRFLLTVNGELDPGYIVFNDNINNGQENERSIFSMETEINRGDSVTVEMRCIDPSTYQYFYTLSQTSGGGPIGGTTPTNPPNNITRGDALGIFAAYTKQVRMQIAQ